MSLRTTLLAVGAGALLYVVAVELFLAFQFKPATATLQHQSQAAFAEFQEGRQRADQLDVMMTDLARLLELARQHPLAIDTLETRRRQLQLVVDSLRTVERMVTPAGASPGLRVALGKAVLMETRRRDVILGAISALETQDVDVAARLLLHADSLDSPLGDALSEAAALALDNVKRREEDLSQTAHTVSRVVWIWLVGGMLLLPGLALLLRRRR